MNSGTTFRPSALRIGERRLACHRTAWISAAIFVVASSQFALTQELPNNFVRHEPPRSLPAIAFKDGEAQQSLTEFKGKVVLLNIWATWCVPCRREMPALDRLQTSLGGSDFEVVAVSIDRGGFETVRKFYHETGIRDLAMYVDPSGQAARAVGALGLPVTLLVDRASKEVGRVTGPAEWDSPEIVEFLKPIIAARSDRGGSDKHDPQARDAQTRRDSALWLGFQWLKALFK